MQVASHFYSYSFALNPYWSRKFSLQPEIVAYFRSLADRNGVSSHISFFSTVHKAEYDDATATWTVSIRDEKTGALRVKRCKILVSAVGALSIPKKCEIPGAEGFRGKIFHSAQWDHSFDWKNKDVVVVGTSNCSFLLRPKSFYTDMNEREWLQRHSIRPHNQRWPFCCSKGHTI